MTAIEKTGALTIRPKSEERERLNRLKQVFQCKTYTGLIRYLGAFVERQVAEERGSFVHLADPRPDGWEEDPEEDEQEEWENDEETEEGEEIKAQDTPEISYSPAEYSGPATHEAYPTADYPGPAVSDGFASEERPPGAGAPCDPEPIWSELCPEDQEKLAECARIEAILVADPEPEESLLRRMVARLLYLLKELDWRLADRIQASLQPKADPVAVIHCLLSIYRAALPDVDYWKKTSLLR